MTQLVQPTLLAPDEAGDGMKREMQSRQSLRSRARPVDRPASELALLVVGPESTGPIHLKVERAVAVGTRALGEVRIVASTDGTVEVRPIGGAAVHLNDVQVRTVAHARAGDLVTLPDRSLLVQRLTPHHEEAVTIAGHNSFEQRLNEEVRRANRTCVPVALSVVRSRALVGDGLCQFLESAELNTPQMRERLVMVGSAAPATLELLLAGTTSLEADDIRGQLSEALGRLGRPFRWGWASAPTDGMGPSTLLGRALDRLFAEQSEAAEEVPRVDPVMVRLWSLCDVWAGVNGGVLVKGEEGSGRETLARAVHERRRLHTPFVVFRSAIFDSSLWRACVDRAAGGTLYVRHVGALPSSELEHFWNASSFRPMAGTSGSEPQAPPTLVTVPALRDRPLDVVPIADHIVARYSGFEGSRKLKLTQAARTCLASEWTRSVRELRNSLQLATLRVDASGAIDPEHFATDLNRPVDEGGTASNLRASLRSVERSTLLTALSRANWNVSAASRALGLPRRTIVYRMSRLGLRRPV